LSIGGGEKKEAGAFDESFVGVLEAIAPKLVGETVGQRPRAELILKRAISFVIHGHGVAHPNLRHRRDAAVGAYFNPTKNGFRFLETEPAVTSLGVALDGGKADRAFPGCRQSSGSTFTRPAS
jgi:hypothetical protein